MFPSVSLKAAIQPMPGAISRLEQDDRAAGGFDFAAGVVDGVDGDVVHEGLAGIHARHKTSIDAGFAFGARFDEEVVHVPGIADLPAEGFFVELFGALHVVSRDFEMNNRIWHSGRMINGGWMGRRKNCDERVGIPVQLLIYRAFLQACISQRRGWKDDAMSRRDVAQPGLGIERASRLRRGFWGVGAGPAELLIAGMLRFGRLAVGLVVLFRVWLFGLRVRRGGFRRGWAGVFFRRLLPGRGFVWAGR